MKMSRVLAVVAHPDDEALGCGGLLSKLSDWHPRLMSTAVMFLNNGYQDRPGFNAVELAKQIHNAGEILGIDRPYVQQFEASRFERYAQNEFNNAVSSVVEEFQPDTILTHDAYDLHKDHRVVHEAVMVASRFKGGASIKNVLTFPTISSSEISPMWKFAPNYYVPLDAWHLSNKILAMQQYTTELELFEGGRGEDAITTWAKFFGLRCNAKYAEPYRIIRATHA